MTFGEYSQLRVSNPMGREKTVGSFLNGNGSALVDIGAVEYSAIGFPALPENIPLFRLPGLLAMIVGFRALLGWRRRR